MTDRVCVQCHRHWRAPEGRYRGIALCGDECLEKYYRKRGWLTTLKMIKKHQAEESQAVAEAARSRGRQSHRIHPNTAASEEWLDSTGLRKKRKAQIARVFAVAKRPVTDREVLQQLHARGEAPNAHDMNHVRPRITELIDCGVLAEIESVPCPVTGRQVRRCALTERGRAAVSDLPQDDQAAE